MSTAPVLLVAFNRPDLLAGLVDRLREVKPTAVYVAVDGPRTHVAGEAARVAATRDQVECIDWPCDVRTLFRDRNLGCGLGVSGAISWFFEHEERGIILEDDVLPHPSLFQFCDELLGRYEHDPRVWAVSGCNLVPPETMGSRDSYRFATVPYIWGWATWRRSWASYQYDIRSWRRRLPRRELWRAAGRSTCGFAYWSAMFDIMARRGGDTWDLQAVLAAFADGGLTATSNVNLIDNVGFGPGATHTDVRPDHLREVSQMRFPLRHPSSVQPDSLSEAWARKHILDATPSGLAKLGWRFTRWLVSR